MDLDLKGKTAVVCGSTQGIGWASAVELAGMGATIVLLARNETRLQSRVAELPTPTGQRHSYLLADFASTSAVESAIGDWVSGGGSAQILINNTGGPPAGLALDAALDDFRVAFNSHLICNQILVQALVPGMKAAHYGRIVNVISTSVKTPIPGLGVSNTIRGAVANWAKTLATELAPHGITVNNMLPGMTWTSRLESLIKTRAEKQGITSDEVAEAMKREIPAGRFGEASELGSVVGFLCTPAAAYVTGINIPVDGGRTPCL